MIHSHLVAASKTVFNLTASLCWLLPLHVLFVVVCLTRKPYRGIEKGLFASPFLIEFPYNDLAALRPTQSRLSCICVLSGDWGNDSLTIRTASLQRLDRFRRHCM